MRVALFAGALLLILTSNLSFGGWDSAFRQRKGLGID